MALKRSVVFLAIIVGVTSSQEISNAGTSGQQRDGAPTGNADTQVRNKFVIVQNASLPSGAQIIAITESGNLVVAVPDMVHLSDPHVIPRLNDSQADAQLHISHEQRNAQVIYNLKHSLITFQTVCEKMAQTVDKHLLENQVDLADDHPRDYHERIWHSSLVLHTMSMNRLERTLKRSIRKFNVGDTITDSDVTRARNDASSVLKSHKRLAMKMQDVLGTY